MDVLCIFFPLVFSFHKAFPFYKNWFAFLPACAISAAVFVGWDILFTHAGIWSFSTRYTLPVRLVNLPLEEVLFFICIPYACMFTYFCVKRYIPFYPSNTAVKSIAVVAAAAMCLTALLHLQQLYTSVTFFALSAFLLFTAWRMPQLLGTFLVSYVLILPFFLLSNGLLTGSFTPEPVVSYNPAHNMGIRLFTIPLEDAFYGMLLLLLNTYLYEYFLQRQQAKAVAA